MTPHLPEILAALALIYVPLLCLWLLWRRWAARKRLVELPAESRFITLHILHAMRFGAGK